MVDQVEVKFGASTDDLNRGVDEVKDKLGEVGSSGDALKDKLLEIGTAIAGVFAVEKISEFVTHIAEASEELTRLSNLTGFSTGNIQALQFAIQLAGGDAEGAAQALTRFERNLYSAASGAGPAYEAFDQVGVKLHDLRTLSETDIFRKTIDGLVDLTDSSERNNLATAIGGRTFAAFVATLHGGSAAIDESKAKLKETGDYLSSDMVKAWADVDEKMKIAGHAFHAIGQNLANDIIVPLKLVVEWATKALEAFNRFVNTPLPGWLGKGFVPNNALPDDDRETASDGIRNASGAKKTQEAATAQTAVDELKDLKGTWDKIRDAHKDVLADMDREELDYWTKAVNDAKLGSDQQLAIQNRIFSLKKSLAEQDQAEQEKVAKKSQKVWDDSFKTIERSFDTMLKGILQGTQTLGQAFQRLGQNLVISMLESFAKTELDWAKTQLQMVAAQISGDQAKVASQVAATAESKAISDTAHSEEIMKDAYGAAAGAYNALAGIPYVGPVIAPIAAGIAFASVAAFDSFDVGTPYVPSDRMAMVHQGEAIIPAKTAQAWRDGDLGGGDTHVHFNVNAMDSKSVGQFFSTHGDLIAKQVRSSVRNGSRRGATRF